MKIINLIGAVIVVLGMSTFANAKSSPAYKVFGKTVSIDEVAKGNKSAFYEIDKKKFDLVNQAAQDEYLNQFFERLAKKEKTSVDQARKTISQRI